jgi:hypothetical protein
MGDGEFMAQERIDNRYTPTRGRENLMYSNMDMQGDSRNMADMPAGDNRTESVSKTTKKRLHFLCKNTSICHFAQKHSLKWAKINFFLCKKYTSAFQKDYV